MVSKLLKGILVVLGLIVATAALASDDDIIGTYNCQGNDPTITPSVFVGKLAVTKQANGAYVIAEVDQHGSAYEYDQLGLRDGDSLAMAFQLVSKPSVFAVQFMKIMQHGKLLKGTFAYWGIPNVIGTETCKKV